MANNHETIRLNNFDNNPSESYYRNIFDRVDTNHDGSISLAELRALADASELQLTRPQLSRLYSLYDENRDGHLSPDEFARMMAEPRLAPLFRRCLAQYVAFVVPRRADEPDGAAYMEEYSCWPPALGMVTLSALIAALFAVDAVREPGSTDAATGAVARALLFEGRRREQAWRYLTYMFVHVGQVHLAMNLIVQIALGVALELVHGWRRVLPLYFVGVVFGSLATAVTDPFAKLAGASGGVYALLTAHIATVIMNWSEMLMPVVHLLMFSLFVVADFGSAIYDRYNCNLDSKIGYVAHVSGAIAGLLVGITVLRNLRRTFSEDIVWWIAAILFGILICIAIFLNAFYVYIDVDTHCTH